MLVCGDIWDKATSTPDSDRLVFEALRECVGHGIQAVLLAGNHDSPRKLEALGLLSELLGVQTQHDVLRPNAGGVLTIEGREHVARIAAVPFITEGRYVSAAEVMGLQEDWFGAYADGVAGILRAICDGFGDERTVNILATHIFVDKVARGAGRWLGAPAAHRADLRHQRAAATDDAPVHRARPRARAAGTPRRPGSDGLQRLAAAARLRRARAAEGRAHHRRRARAARDAQGRAAEQGPPARRAARQPRRGAGAGRGGGRRAPPSAPRRRAAGAGHRGARARGAAQRRRRAARVRARRRTRAPSRRSASSAPPSCSRATTGRSTAPSRCRS